MLLSEAMKIALRYRQCPLTAQQIAYFICTNNILRADSLQVLARQVEEEALHNPAHFTETGDLIYLSPWQNEQQQVVQHVFGTVQKACEVLGGVAPDKSSCHNLMLALLLYKRLSDIKRSQQGEPIVPVELKFNRTLANTAPNTLPERVLGVMEYVECTDIRLADSFLFGKAALSTVQPGTQAARLQEAMQVLSKLNLDEDHVPTPLFQAIFSRLFWNNVKYSGRGIGVSQVERGN